MDGGGSVRRAPQKLSDYLPPALAYAAALAVTFLALVSFDAQRQGLARKGVQERTDMASMSVTRQIEDLASRATALGEQTFRAPRSSSAELDLMMRGLGLEAAGVFTGTGVPIRRSALFESVLDDSLVGDLWSRVGKGLRPMGLVDQDVGPPVLAFLVPLKSVAGPRIFGGVIKADDNALGRYLSSGAAPGTTAALVDARGSAMATMGSAGQADALAEAFARGLTKPTLGGRDFFLTDGFVPGVEWHFVVATPVSVLDPTGGPVRNGLWTTAAAIAVLGLFFVKLSVRTRRTRRELEASTRLVRQRNGELVTANRRVSELVEMISHDVRQPLGVVIGYAELALDAADPRTRGSHLERVTAAARAANELLDETLASTMLGSGNAVPSPRPVDLDTFIRDAARACSYQLDEDDVVVNCPVEAHVDPRHLRQIVGNLVGNTLKYGSLPISVTGWTGTDSVVIEYADSGPGVDPAFVPRLFDRYSREDGASGHAAGSGLGLAIVHDLVTANDGTIEYRAGGGACFVLTFPASRGLAPDQDVTRAGRASLTGADR